MAELWWLMFWLGTAVFVAVCVALAAAALKRHHAPRVAARETAFLLVFGAVVPAVVIGVVLVGTVRVGAQLFAEREAEIRIDIIGHQFWWEVRYPDRGAVTANEVHVPVGSDVVLRLSAVDVIHSFWAPQLGGKMDLVPGRVNELTLRADHAGTYHGWCAEFCGIQHTNMRLLVVAEPPDRFAAWLDAQARDAASRRSPAAARGRELFERLGCAACHIVRGDFAEGGTGTPGPDLTHLMSRQTIAALTLELTREALARWIVNAQEIKPGSGMPSFTMDGEELRDLLEYLEALR